MPYIYGAHHYIPFVVKAEKRGSGHHSVLRLIAFKAGNIAIEVAVVVSENSERSQFVFIVTVVVRQPLLHHIRYLFLKLATCLNQSQRHYFILRISRGAAQSLPFNYKPETRFLQQNYR